MGPVYRAKCTSASFILMYDSMYSNDDRGNLIPRAALEIPTTANGGISADGKTYTIKLKPGQKHSDGSPVMATDYVYAIKRYVDPTLASNYASFMSDLVGYKELNADGNDKKSAAELKPLLDKLDVAAKDANTLVFTLATRARRSRRCSPSGVSSRSRRASAKRAARTGGRTRRTASRTARGCLTPSTLVRRAHLALRRPDRAARRPHQRAARRDGRVLRWLGWTR